MRKSEEEWERLRLNINELLENIEEMKETINEQQNKIEKLSEPKVAFDFYHQSKIC